MSTSTLLQLSDPIQARYDALLEISESIVSHQQLSSLIGDLYRCLKPLISFDFLALCLYNAERQTTRQLAKERPLDVHDAFGVVDDVATR